jgi:hypothetical protein
MKHLPFLSVASLLIAPSHIHATDLARWDFSGLSGTSASAPATSLDPAVQSAGDITRGGGLTAASASGGFSSSAWTTGNAPDANDFYQFSITPAPGSILDIDTLHFAEERTATGVTFFEVRSSMDNFASTIGAAIAVPDDTAKRDQSLTLGAAFDAIAAPVTFRIYGYAAEGNTGTWRLANHSDKAGLLLEGSATSATGILSVNVTPAVFSESATNPAASGTVTRTGDLTNALTVNLSSSDAGEATIPATVEIPANESQAFFDITAVDDLVPDGDVAVTLTAAAAGYTTGLIQLTVQDDGDAPPLVINELDSETPGTDNAEFIELHNKAAEAVSLDGYVLVFFNGTDDLSYRTIDLSGNTIPANGFFVIGNAGVSGVNVTFPIGGLQNGADAVALYQAAPQEIPDGAAVASIAATLVDAVVYGTNNPDDAELLAALTPGKPQVDEGSGAVADANSISRVPDGGAAFDTTLFVRRAPSPGSTNTPSSIDYASWALNHVANQGARSDYDGDGLDNGTEYFMGTDADTFTPNPGLDNGTITWPRASGTVIAAFKVEVSQNLTTWEDAALNYSGNLSITPSGVSFTPPAGSGRLFVRLAVTP